LKDKHTRTKMKAPIFRPTTRSASAATTQRTGGGNARPRLSSSPHVRKRHAHAQRRSKTVTTVPMHGHHRHRRARTRTRTLPPTRTPPQRRTNAAAVPFVYARQPPWTDISHTHTHTTTPPFSIDMHQMIEKSRIHTRLFRTLMATKAEAEKSYTLAAAHMPHNPQKFHPLLHPDKMRTLEDVRRVELNRYIIM